MDKTAIVRSVYHNGGCHKNLPMYTGYDVNLPDEEFRDADPPSMAQYVPFWIVTGSKSCRLTPICRVRWAGAKCGRRPDRTAAS